MPRRVRKVTLYVCTIDGSIHPTRAAAKAVADRLDAAKPRAAPRRGSARGPTHVDAILKAVAAGAADGKSVRDRSGVPPRLVHPTISNLKKRGLLKGKSGNLALTREGRARLALTRAA